jgi:hypothetical protein
MKNLLLATATMVLVATAANAGEPYLYACEVKEDVDGHVVKGDNTIVSFFICYRSKNTRLYGAERRITSPTNRIVRNPAGMRPAMESRLIFAPRPKVWPESTIAVMT